MVLILASCVYEAPMGTSDKAFIQYEKVKLGSNRSSVEALLGAPLHQSGTTFYYIEFDKPLPKLVSGVPMELISIQDYLIGRVKVRYNNKNLVIEKSFIDYDGSEIAISPH